MRIIRMLAAAVRAGEAVGYRGAGTVEFLVDPVAQEFAFLEMTTRLQVEHPVTEMVTGIDLVEQQFRIAAGERVAPAGAAPGGHAIEFRVHAEDPRDFRPATGEIKVWEEPVGDGIRIDAGYHEGNSVTHHYDSLLAKLIVFGNDRNEALARARNALGSFVIEGVHTTIPFLNDVVRDERFMKGQVDTSFLERFMAERVIAGQGADR